MEATSIPAPLFLGFLGSSGLLSYPFDSSRPPGPFGFFGGLSPGYAATAVATRFSAPGTPEVFGFFGLHCLFFCPPSD
jgi:hypothetical protein